MFLCQPYKMFNHILIFPFTQDFSVNWDSSSLNFIFFRIKRGYYR